MGQAPPYGFLRALVSRSGLRLPGRGTGPLPRLLPQVRERTRFGVAVEVGDQLLSTEVFRLVVDLLLDPPLHPDEFRGRFTSSAHDNHR